MTPSIRHIASGVDVEELRAQLYARPEVWNRYTTRTCTYSTPHSQVSDVWVRFRPWIEVEADPAHACDEHASEFYPEAELIPAVFSVIARVMEVTGARQLGGVLITKIPPGGKVAPHVDHGWHARYYEKFAVQIQGNGRQAFCFEDSELRPESGDLYTFDNSRLHWVSNDSDEDRITLIICAK